MIQFNLLPDVKLQYLKVRRTQHLVLTGSIIAIAVSVFVLVVLIGTVDVLQKKNISDLNRDINSTSSQLTGTPNLNKILTVQNQLQALTTLHNQKPVASRLFGYLKQLTPANASISQFGIDFTQNNVTLTGSAASLDIVKNYAETLKLTTYTQSGQSGSKPAFSAVVLSQFSRSSTGASYTITANFDPNIFNSADNVSLTVPKIAAPPADITQSSELFQSSGGQ